MNRTALAFLPAAIEVQHTPPPVASRLILGSIGFFFIVAVCWAVVGQVDIVTVAAGKIIPSGRVKAIQSLEIGIVRSIHVKEGQWVEQGALLLSLDPTNTAADRDKIANDLRRTRLEHDRALQLIYFIQNNEIHKVARGIRENNFVQESALGKSSSKPSVDFIQSALLQSQVVEMTGRILEYDHQGAQNLAQQHALKALIAKIQATLPIVAKRASAAATMYHKKLGAEDPYLLLEEQRLTQLHEAQIQQLKLAELRLLWQRIKDAKSTLIAQLEKDLLAEVSDSQRQISALTQEQVKSQRRDYLRQLTAPVTGMAQNLSIHTVGGVVRPAEVLLNIVPISQSMQVQAWMQNKDIGFVMQGQTAEVKIEAFPFTKFGIIAARVNKLSADAVADEHLGLVFGALIGLEKNFMMVGAKQVRLLPGMSVSVEIKTGQRRIIDYILGPLMQYSQEAFRER